MYRESPVYSEHEHTLLDHSQIHICNVWCRKPDLAPWSTISGMNCILKSFSFLYKRFSSTGNKSAALENKTKLKLLQLRSAVPLKTSIRKVNKKYGCTHYLSVYTIFLNNLVKILQRTQGLINLLLICSILG